MGMVLFNLHCIFSKAGSLSSLIIMMMMMMMMMMIIVSTTKLSIVIGSPRAYLSRNRRGITWVSNRRYTIWTFCNWIPIIGYPCDSQLLPNLMRVFNWQPTCFHVLLFFVKMCCCCIVFEKLSVCSRSALLQSFRFLQYCVADLCRIQSNFCSKLAIELKSLG